MLIKKNKKKFLYKSNFTKLKSPIVKLIILLFTFSSYTLLISFIFNLSLKNNIKLPIAIKSRIKDSSLYHLYKGNLNLINIPKNIIKGSLAKTDKIYIDIKFKNLQKLNNKREHALNKKVLISNDKDFVDAKISNFDEKLDSKIRLKGDWSDHLIGNKWSFRVKIDDKKTFNGLNKFSLQSPKTRNFIWEWLYHEILRIEGFPALRYYFNPLVFNGNDLGTYAVEEHFDKILLESNNFKEGPIIKLSESLLWLQRDKTIKEGIEIIDSHDQLTRTYVEVFKKNYTLQNEELYGNFIKASHNLNGFIRGSLKTSEVFDTKKLATFLAISDLINAHHGLIWHNQRFYFDPISELLIPIGFDGDAGKPLLKLAIDKEGLLNYFEDIEFLKNYFSELKRLSNINYLDSLFKKLNAELNYQLSIIHKSYPAYYFDKKVIINNQKKISNSINPINPFHAFLNTEKNNYLELNIANNQSWPIQILGVYKDAENIDYLQEPVLIKGKSLNDFPDYKIIKLSKAKLYKHTLNKPLEVQYKIYGDSELKKLSVKPYERLVNNYEYDKTPNISEFKFLIINKIEKTIKVKSGNWLIDKPLIIPSNFKFIIKNNSQLTLSKNGFIYSKSPIEFIGSINKPVIIKGENLGNGILILNANKNSFIQNVIFKNLSNPRNNLWSIPGSITFYQSPVDIENCLFESNNSEDNLNIVRTRFSIKDSVFINSKADAIDIDFSKGKINNLSIIKAGNDGLDISGSEIKVKDIFIKDIGDKGISGGEISFLEGKNIKIIDTNIAFASKDKTILELENINIEKANIGFAIFKKKEEYGPAKIKVLNLKKNIIKTLFELEEKSFLKINEKTYKPNTINLRSKLY